MTALTQEDREAITSILENGGSHTITLEEADVGMTDEVRQALGNRLHTGFDLPPTSLIYLDKEATEILALSRGWTQIPVLVYRADGKIIYKRLPNGRYEAQITI